MRPIQLCLELLAVLAVANASVMDALRQVPNGWSFVGSPAPSQTMHFRIAMTQPRIGLFEQLIYDVSTPSHPSYGRHMSKDELQALLEPGSEATTAVLQWLETSGIRSADISSNGDWIHFVAPISQAEALLDTKFHLYSNSYNSERKVRTTQYSVPDHLHRYIDMVQPTTRFGQVRPQTKRLFDAQYLGKAHTGLNTTTCNSTITPSCLKSLYNVETPKRNTSSGFIGINGFLEEYARFADFATFEEEYAPWMKNESFTWTSINGGILNQTYTGDSGEANLDVQYALSLGWPLPGNFYSTGGRGYLVPDLDQPTLSDDDNEPYLDFLQYILALPDDELPHTLSTSYGEDEQSVPESYARTVCNMFGQLGLRGVSVLFSSGDTGVGSACQTNDGKNTTRFLPIFPAACPYVTSVGGTYRVEPERAISFSSGGFSDLWDRPAYQDEAVNEYLNILGDRWDGLYNKAGRGFPDVAAQAYHFHIIDQGQESLVSGTSCASPTFAGVVGLLNSARINAGMPPLGFLNPFIYDQGYTGLTDIVDGGSTGCDGTDEYSGLPTPLVPYASWNATKGWDPVTGYGTPNYGKLLKLVMKSRYSA